ncbi:hypothetical protein H0I76_05355 [Limibaculum sp. M0105]|uniref:Uncharacterized protein n=1 Tax=Thermohalobaculum xanthum TaxID=2753746 RepID=A0A8J7M518_9RHOB|nr:hypothetical protein [Thermohalobaculum xanthum]MBK0398606.1 hypothetical protein [Thermohalobaculum xanthum]
MLAVGTLVQRGDVVAEFLSGEPEPTVLAKDVISVDADTLTRLDVLANDTGLSDRDASKLVVLAQPECGRVFVQNGALQYLGDRSCAAAQKVLYGLAGIDTEAHGEVEITLRGVKPAADKNEPEAPSNVVALRQVETTPATPRASASPTRDPVPSASAPASLAREPAPTRPVAGSQGIGRAAGGDGAGDAPARPGIAGADAPVATGVPSVDAPSSPGAGAPSLPSQVPADRPVATPSEPPSPAPARPGSGPQLALRAPESPGLPSTANPTVPRDRASVSAASDPSVSPAAPGLAALSEPSAPGAPAGIGSDLAPPRIGGDSAVAGLGGAEAAPERELPGDLGQGVATFALARVEVPDAVAAPSRAQASDLTVDPGARDGALSAPRVAPEIDATDGQRITILEPSAGLGEILTFGDPLTLRPIDTSLPSLATPSDAAGGSAPDLRQAAVEPSGAALQGAGATAQPGSLPQPDQIAALPRVDQTCAVPPSITLDIRPAGETELVITSPCHADSIAQLSYEGIDLGIRIDRSGQGALSVLGFRSSSEALLAFDDGETLEFSLPFTGTDRVERVALSWDAPVLLELHALEFGAGLGTEGHVSPAAPGDFREVRRRGGGYLTSYAPVEGVGQSVQIYSYWLRRGGDAGVVKLYIDFASRHRERQEGTCGNGPLSRPAFTVIRSSRGRSEQPVSRRLASIECSRVDTMQNHLIEAAVRDIIISQR